jgi:hypothetical protein
MIEVQVRVIILSLYSIDTTNEQYSAEIYVEACWPYEQAINEFRYFNTNWSPQIKILNTLEEKNSKIWYQKKKLNEKLHVFEMQKINGTFFAKLELRHYPFDVQKLHVNLISNEPLTKCILVNNETLNSIIIEDDFRDFKEWYLYDFVGIEDYEILSNTYDINEESRSIVSYYCVVARKTRYFYCNSLFLIFLLTFISLCSFTLKVDDLGFRFEVLISLILSLVSFKLVINENLPSLDYLTILDLYSIFSIVFLAIITLWHSIIGFSQRRINTLTAYKIDFYVFLCVTILLCVLHIVAIVWGYFYVYEPRRMFKSFSENSKKKFLMKKQMPQERIELSTSR